MKKEIKKVISDDVSLVSVGASTEQSSTGYSGISSRAVDGNTDGHYFQSVILTIDLSNEIGIYA